jgi:hypothetical protein
MARYASLKGYSEERKQEVINGNIDKPSFYCNTWCSNEHEIFRLLWIALNSETGKSSEKTVQRAEEVALESLLSWRDWEIAFKAKDGKVDGTQLFQVG